MVPESFHTTRRLVSDLRSSSPSPSYALSRAFFGHHDALLPISQWNALSGASIELLRVDFDPDLRLL